MKALFSIAIFFIFISKSFANSEVPRVLMMVADGFYAPEYYVPLEVFKKAGFQVTTATKLKGLTRPDHRQIDEYEPIRGDITFDEVRIENFDLIVFSGGNGVWEDFFPNEDVHRILTSFIRSGKVTALLCSSTGLLGVANNFDGNGKPVAEGKKVTGYKRVEFLLKLGKTKFSKGDSSKPFVVVDENLIKGRDPMSAELFASAVVAEVNKRLNYR